MPKRPSRDVIREKTLHAALAVVDESGHAALNARSLAATAGCSVGTLYNVFGDLDGVVSALNLQTVKALRQTLSDALDGAGKEPYARLSALADAYFDFAQDAPRRWEALFRARAKGPVDGMVREEGDALFALLKESVGGAVPDDALLALWAAVHGVVELATQQHLIYHASGSERRYLRFILDAAMKGFAADSASAGR